MLPANVSLTRRNAGPIVLFAIVILSTVYYRAIIFGSGSRRVTVPVTTHDEHKNPAAFNWARVKPRYPVTSYIPLPSPPARALPKLQHTPSSQTGEPARIRQERLQAVKAEFVHAWDGYRKHAWLQDEVRPLSGGVNNPFGGWAATLVDSLDTLWIMDMKPEFEEALAALDKIDFTTCSLDHLNVFETTIRYLGGFLAAHDLTDGKYPYLLEKATELGEMLYVAFDTPNRMPVTRWDFKKAMAGAPQVAPDTVLVAEIGSLTLEMTRLSQLTGDPKYFDAVQRIMDLMDEQQGKTKLPGLWPVIVDAEKLDFTKGAGFTLGGMADSAYEYLPKQHMLMGGATDQYKRMYELSLSTMKQHIFYRPMLPNMDDVLFAGQVNSDGNTPASQLQTEPQVQHLACFVPGMVAIGAKLFHSEADMEIAEKLVKGCLWAYEAAPLGVQPEIFHTVSCANNDFCSWDERLFNSAVESSHNNRPLPPVSQRTPGMVIVDDARYILRPEAIESVFIMYRITGDRAYQDRAWKMFESIIKHTKTSIAHAALADCTVPEAPKMDSMESFFLAETLKYFYLIFADEELVNLDDWVLNTEAHPLRRPS